MKSEEFVKSIHFEDEFGIWLKKVGKKKYNNMLETSNSWETIYNISDNSDYLNFLGI